MVEHHTAQVGEVRLHYVTAGKNGDDREPLVLLHGFPQSWYEWRHIIPDLAARYRVIAPDLRGLGGSSKPHAGYDKMTMAKDVVGLLRDELEVEQILLVGHDWGAGVAYALAAHEPEFVRKLAILEMVLPGIPLPGMSADALGQYWHMAFHGVRDLPEALIQGRERTYISWFFSNFAYDPTAISSEDIDEYERCMATPGALRAGFEYYRAMGEDGRAFAAAAAKKKLPMPVLALGGTSSIGASVKLSMEQVATSVVGGVIERCGHWIPEEQPRELLDQLMPFLEHADA